MINSGVHDRATELIAAARSGEPAAIGLLFGMYQNYVRLLAATQIQQRLQARVTASDVVQDTFLQAHRAFEQFRGETGAEFLGWLRSILASRIGDLYEKHFLAQRRDVRRETSLEQITKNLDRSNHRLESIIVDQHAGSPLSAAERHERVLVVAEALAELNSDYRRVLVLRHLEGLSFNEVADRMDRTSGAVRMVWLRAINKLREELNRREQL
ncbi:MAG: sigma-70 family RNA polymerase sigma factor [Planctomycetota bacterium]